MTVEGAAGDASKCSAAGPGIERTGVQVNKKTYFEVFTKGTFIILNQKKILHKCI